MKNKIKLGSITATEMRTTVVDGIPTLNTYTPFEVKDIELEFEISAEEMLTQMKNFKEFSTGLLELYKIIKGEIISGEVSALVKACNELKAPSASETSTPE